MAQRASIAILIPTKNEEINLPYALASVCDWAEQVFVLDSGSTDRTREVAERYGACFVFHAWEGYARQKNWALDNLPITTRWVFILDADELITPALRDELIDIANADNCPEDAFYVNRHFVFLGKRIRHSGYYPSWNIRFFRRGKARYEQREVHEHMIAEGKVGYLRAEMEHNDRRGLGHFIAKHNHYSTLEARELYRVKQNLAAGRMNFGFWAGPIERRRWVKHKLWPRIPARWLVRWFYMYILQLGFLDGMAGFHLAFLIGAYEHDISLKLKELEREHLRGALPDLPIVPPEPPATPTRTAAEAAPQSGATMPVEASPTEPVAAVSPGVSVLILTYNEEINLPDCLRSVAWSDDIVVFDSFSTDRTVEIARAYGCRVYQRHFDNERNQRTASIAVPFKHPWVYNPDADEITPPALRDEILAVTSDPGRAEVAYRVRFRLMFMGRWIKHSSLYPTWVVRLFRPEKLRFEREINLRYVLDGPEGRLRGYFEHHSFRKGLHAWYEKHNVYSTFEAREAMKVLGARRLNWGWLFGNATQRRALLKDLSFRLPYRASLIYFYLMFIRGGVLDGPSGWIYCRMRAQYEYMISTKVKELRLAQKGLTT